MRRFAMVACLGLVFLSGRSGLTQDKKDPPVAVVKYDALAQHVLKHRGKVVLVDIWFLT